MNDPPFQLRVIAFDRPAHRRCEGRVVLLQRDVEEIRLNGARIHEASFPPVPCYGLLPSILDADILLRRH